MTLRTITITALLIGWPLTTQAREETPRPVPGPARDQQANREFEEDVDDVEHLPANNPLAIYARTEAALRKAVREGSISELDAQICLAGLRILLAARYERDVPEPGGRWF